MDMSGSILSVGPGRPEGGRCPPRRGRAFTLIELIAVIIVLAILSGVAVPRYLDMSTRARASATSATLRVMKTAVLAYNRDTGRWPADVQPRRAPSGLHLYMEPGVWTAMTPVGVVWDYENWSTPQWGWPTPVVGVSIRSGHGGTWSGNQVAVMNLVERQLDDGAATTGNLRTVGHGYFYVIANR